MTAATAVKSNLSVIASPVEACHETAVRAVDIANGRPKEECTQCLTLCVHDRSLLLLCQILQMILYKIDNIGRGLQRGEWITLALTSAALVSYVGAGARRHPDVRSGRRDRHCGEPMSRLRGSGRPGSGRWSSGSWACCGRGAGSDGRGTGVRRPDPTAGSWRRPAHGSSPRRRKRRTSSSRVGRLTRPGSSRAARATASA